MLSTLVWGGLRKWTRSSTTHPKLLPGEMLLHLFLYCNLNAYNGFWWRRSLWPEAKALTEHPVSRLARRELAQPLLLVFWFIAQLMHAFDCPFLTAAHRGCACAHMHTCMRTRAHILTHTHTHTHAHTHTHVCVQNAPHDLLVPQRHLFLGDFTPFVSSTARHLHGKNVFFVPVCAWEAFIEKQR